MVNREVNKMKMYVKIWNIAEGESNNYRYGIRMMIISELIAYRMALEQ